MAEEKIGGGYVELGVKGAEKVEAGKRALENMSKAMQAFSNVAAQTRAVTDQFTSPMEKLIAKQEKYNHLLEHGGLDAKIYQRAIDNVKESIESLNRAQAQADFDKSGQGFVPLSGLQNFGTQRLVMERDERVAAKIAAEADAEERLNQLRFDARNALLAIASPQEMHTARLARYTEMLKSTIITQAQYNQLAAESSRVMRTQGSAFGKGGGQFAFQASYALQDVATVASMPGMRMQDALRAGANNVSQMFMLVSAINPITAALAATGVTLAAVFGPQLWDAYVNGGLKAVDVTKSLEDAMRRLYDAATRSQSKLADTFKMRDMATGADTSSAASLVRSRSDEMALADAAKEDARRAFDIAVRNMKNTPPDKAVNLAASGGLGPLDRIGMASLQAGLGPEHAALRNLETRDPEEFKKALLAAMGKDEHSILPVATINSIRRMVDAYRRGLNEADRANKQVAESSEKLDKATLDAADAREALARAENMLAQAQRNAMARWTLEANFRDEQDSTRRSRAVADLRRDGTAQTAESAVRLAQEQLEDAEAIRRHKESIRRLIEQQDANYATSAEWQHAVEEETEATRNAINARISLSETEDAEADVVNRRQRESNDQYMLGIQTDRNRRIAESSDAAQSGRRSMHQSLHESSQDRLARRMELESQLRNPRGIATFSAEAFKMGAEARERIAEYRRQVEGDSRLAGTQEGADKINAFAEREKRAMLERADILKLENDLDKKERMRMGPQITGFAEFGRNLQMKLIEPNDRALKQREAMIKHLQTIAEQVGQVGGATTGGTQFAMYASGEGD